ncbi:winged helix-turn-helix domain-containing protein [Saccharopolyspora indica]|uniref:BTAD domain-containing putative transcriptional regulator n=1 Tax=Saccharopolyspora indica TaxID=1229659 RepID=UPI0022EBA010|nr:BTAD domain-containing putative transcriptional regulator [Saccharopolyspora indica]MDA3649187.1 BTAD domain-containing putative transcriptional regulator [Saccharopolyspora indica]
MYFEVLGPLTVRTRTGSTVEVPEPKVRALLAVLLVHEGRAVSTDQLVDVLWGERPPGNPAGALQTKVSRLRRALSRTDDATEVEAKPPGYRLRIRPEDLDSQRFADLTATAYRTEDPHSRADLLREALALWTGDALAGFDDVEFLRTAAARFEEQRLTAVEALAETRLQLGEHHALIGDLDEPAARHPLRERLRAAQIKALYLAGRQSEALTVYTGLRAELAEQLGVDPGPELTALHQSILEHDASLGAVPPARERIPNELEAPLTDLVGREDAVPAVRELLAGNRLVTLTGPGGVGKTRLADEVARQAVGDFPDGVRKVGLAGSAEVTEQLSAALGIREEGALGLVAALRSRRFLLLLDNCEHVIDEAAEVVRGILSAAPGLRVLATSREPLGLAGEAVWTVPPLRQADAEQLFALRAAASAPGFAVTEHNAEAVATICRRLDRIPLALELAATRVRALGVRELSARLDDRFRLLAGGHRGAPPRQRTLRAVIDWSWELLADDERRLLRRLSAFTGGCTLDAAETVCGEDVLDPMIRLVDRSMVTATEEPRYRLPETVSAYARERLAEAGESDALHDDHRTYYAELIGRAAAELRGPDQHRWLALLDRESGNLRVALERAAQLADGTAALRLALDSTWYWFLRGRLSEARRSLGEVRHLGGDTALRSQAALWHAAFAMLVGEEHSDSALPDAATGCARAEWFLGYAALNAGEDLARSEVLVDRALERFRAADDRWGIAAAQSTRATQALLRGNLVALRRNAEEAQEIFAELGDRWGQLQTAYPLAALASITGDYARAEHLHRTGLELAEELGFRAAAADRITGLGRVALQTGDFRQAAALHREAMTRAAEHGYAAGEIHAEIGLALGARREGDWALAEKHLRRTLDWHREVEFGPGPALLLAELGFLGEQRGDARTALALHGQSLTVARESGDPRAIALAHEGLAGAYALLEQPERAARLLGAAARARESVGAPLPEAERGDVDRITARIRAVLSDAAFAAEFAAGAEEPTSSTDF